MSAFHVTTVLSTEDFQRLWSREHQQVFAHGGLPQNPFKDGCFFVTAEPGKGRRHRARRVVTGAVGDPMIHYFAHMLSQ